MKRRGVTRRRILVVDDDPEVCAMISFVLADRPFDVMTATTGSDAIHRATHDQPDLILIDASMPLVTGAEVIRRVRAESVNTPVVLLTATSYPDRLAREVGAVAYLTKPFELDDLLATIDRYCSII
jgi:two-component system OmpR family response regulator